MDALPNTGAGRTPALTAVHSTPTPDPPLSAEQVYRAYAPRVYHVARKMVRSDADAEDVTQDVLLKVVRKLPTFRGRSAFPTWLHRVTVNTALSYRRKHAVREEHRARDPFDIVLAEAAAPAQGWDGASAPEVHLLTGEARHLIERAIAGLPPTYGTVFVLADVEGLPNAAIADTLGLSLPAVKSRLHRARLLMRDALAPHFQERDAWSGTREENRSAATIKSVCALDRRIDCGTVIP
jgi:RNA polymerase sigma-70 factor (ECF subfamily)